MESVEEVERELFHFDRHFTGHRLRQARERWRVTQAVLARRTGVSAAAISNWELGRRVPSLKNLWTLLFVLQVPAETILGLNPIPLPTKTMIK